MTNALAKLPTTSDETRWTEDQKALIKFAGLYKKVGPDRFELAPAEVVMAFLSHAERSGLDPIAKQIYCIERGGRWTIQGAIDGFRVVAGRHSDYAGQDTQWSADGITWVDAWVSDDNPAAARVNVYKRGVERPTTGVATWKEFAVVGKGGEMWAKMPSHMLAKVAEALALRKAFPNDFSGIYTPEELGNDGHDAIAVADTRDWVTEAEALTDVGSLTALYTEYSNSGEYTKYGDGKFRAHRAYLLMEAEKAAEADKNIVDADVVEEGDNVRLVHEGATA